MTNKVTRTTPGLIDSREVRSIDENNNYTYYPNVDYMYGPYESVEAAYNALAQETDNIGATALVKGKTVGVIEDGKIVEYWFESDPADATAGYQTTDLVKKDKYDGGAIVDTYSKQQIDNKIQAATISLSRDIDEVSVQDSRRAYLLHRTNNNLLPDSASLYTWTISDSESSVVDDTTYLDCNAISCSGGGSSTPFISCPRFVIPKNTPGYYTFSFYLSGDDSDISIQLGGLEDYMDVSGDDDEEEMIAATVDGVEYFNLGDFLNAADDINTIGRHVLTVYLNIPTNLNVAINRLGVDIDVSQGDTTKFYKPNFSQTRTATPWQPT